MEAWLTCLQAGLLDEAQKLIKTMPMRSHVLIWGALLSACKNTGKFELSHEILDRPPLGA